MRVLLVFVLFALAPVCYSADPAQNPSGHPHKHTHKHLHKQCHQQPCNPCVTCDRQPKPGYFFCKNNGQYYPKYQQPRFFQNEYCRHHKCDFPIHPQPNMRPGVFNRYYTPDGLSKEYYMPLK